LIVFGALWFVFLGRLACDRRMRHGLMVSLGR
jgi:hypothetical protein